MKKWFNEKILSNNKNLLLFIGASIFFLLGIYQIVLLINGTYYNSNSDDVAQYSVILRQYIEMLKSGDFSWYNFSNNFGSSTFADIYYVPIDIFSLFTFLLSFIMNPVFAFSCVELSKILLGILAFAYFLQKCKFNNKVVLLVSFIYFCAGGSWTFSVYPTYFSLFFYLPFSLLVVRWFCEGKKWILPLYCLALVFYNFYNAYSLFIFMVFVYIVIRIRDNYKDLKTLIKDVFVFGLHIVLGVVMGICILLPSVLYIINYSARNVKSIEVVFDFSIYMKMIYRLFVYEASVVNLNLGHMIEGTYYQRHFSYYIGLFGLYVVSLMFVLKDRTSKIYKWSLIIVAAMMAIPAFSMIFSGVAVAYTRWFTYINIILLYYFAYVLNDVDITKISKKNKFFVLMGLASLFFINLIYNAIQVVISSSEDKMYYLYVILMLILFALLGGLCIVFHMAKKKDLLISMVVVEMLVVLCINFSTPLNSADKMNLVKGYEEINKELKKININKENLERVYLTDVFQYNSNRLSNNLTNEGTFHSFLTKYIYDYINLYNVDNYTSLVLFDLDNFSVNTSRIMDYKYIVVNKNTEYGYGLEYLDEFYENEDFIVYENKDYNPFYVYEDYYEEEQVINSKGEISDFLQFSKNLFKGVILEENNYALNKKEFSYLDSESQMLDFNHKTSLVKEGDSYVEYVNFDYEYTGVVYINGEEKSKLNKVYIINGENKRECDIVYGLYSCEFENKFDKIIFESNEELNELSYIIGIDKEDQKYAYIKTDNLFVGDYLDYFELTSRNDFLVVSGDGEIRRCLSDFCSLYNFNVDHALKAFDLNYYSQKDGELHLLYDNENLDYYHNNKKDIYANNKTLTYRGSTINVKYNRISSSNNDQLVVLPITYSEEWVCEDENYELVRANGGFLGIVVKNGIKNIDVSIKFEPNGVKIGLLGSILGFVIYGSYIGVIYYRKKRGK